MNQTIFITGASSGIGKATAVLFAKKGWKVYATMRHPEKETELVKLANVTCLKLDVTNPSEIKKVVDDVLKTATNVDVVVNNAGYSLEGPFEASTEDQVHQQFETNVFGMMNVIREILPHFRERRKGTIINISSMGGKIAFPLYSLYHGTKWAIEGFSESLQHELVQFNIRVKLIEPGNINTEFYGGSSKILTKKDLNVYDRYINKAMPYMKKVGLGGSDPSIVAATIFQAATDNTWKLRYPTGKNAKLALTMKKLLPDSLYTRIIRKMVTSS